MNSQPIPLGPFTRGVNLLDPIYRLGPDELSKCENWELTPTGDLQKRAGFTKFGSAPAKINGDNLVNFLYRYYKSDGTKKTLAAANGNLYSINDSTGAATLITMPGSLNVSNLIDGFVYKDRLYLLDGTRPQRYNNTDLLFAGGFSHISSGWTATPGTGGSLTISSTYKYIMTNVAGTMGEGPPSAAKSVSLNSSQNSVALTVLDSAPASYEATAKNLYRTKAGGTIYYYVTQLAAGATNYTDTLADSALGNEYIPVHVPPTDVRFAVVGPDERIYYFGRSGVNASLVEPSDPGFPDRILDSEFFAVNNNDGDIVTAGGRASNGVVFFKRNSCWLLRAFGYGLDNIAHQIGTAARFSVVETPYGLVFLSQEGRVYLYDGQLHDIGSNILTEFSQMTDAAMGRVVACYENYSYRIAYDPRGANAYNTREMRYDFLGRKWDGPHVNAEYLTPSYFSVWDSYKDQGQLLWGESKASKGSYLYKLNLNSSLDDTSNKNIATAETGKGLVGGRGEKIFYRVGVKGQFSTDAKITIAHINDDNVSTEAEVGFGSGVSPSNLFTLGTSLLGGSSVLWGNFNSGQGEEVFGIAARARTSQLRITDKGSATSALIEEMVLLGAGLEFK